MSQPSVCPLLRLIRSGRFWVIAGDSAVRWVGHEQPIRPQQERSPNAHQCSPRRVYAHEIHRDLLKAVSPMNRSRFALPLLPLFFALLPALNSSAESRCIQGKVVDPTGAAVPFAFVSATSLDRRTSTQVQVGRNGRFRIDQGLTDGQYDVLATDRSETDGGGFLKAVSIGAIRVKAAAESLCPRIVLLMPARAHLLVQARDALTGAQLEPVHAHFRLDTEKHWRGGVDERGELLVPPGSDLEIEAGAHGYLNSPVFNIASAQPGETSEVAVELRREQTGCIQGMVLDLRGAGVAGAGIQIGSSDAIFQEGGGRVFTDAKGLFSIGNLEPGEYHLFATAAGYPPSLAQLSMMMTVTVGQDRNCALPTMRLGPKASELSVRVLDDLTLEPVASPKIWVSEESANTGGWSLRAGGILGPVPAFTALTVRASGEGYLDAQPLIIAPMEPEQTREITIRLQPVATRCFSDTVRHRRSRCLTPAS